MTFNLICTLGGGLGNRLHALYSTYYIIRRHQIPIKYFWQTGKKFGCNFTDIFDQHDITFTKDKSIFDAVYYKQKWDNVLTLNEKQEQINWRCPFDAQIENEQVNTRDRIFKSFVDIKLNNSIYDIINNIFIPSNTIGIHIRGGDIKNGQYDIQNDRRNYVGTPQVLSVIESLLDVDDYNLFLTAEDEEDKHLFLQHYPQTIHLNGTHCRDTVDGIRFAFANLILLSKCSKIVGINSSFSSLACKIGNIQDFIQLC